MLNTNPNTTKKYYPQAGTTTLLITLLALLTLTAVMMAGTTNTSYAKPGELIGRVNASVNSFERLKNAGQTKNVEVTCDFTKIMAGRYANRYDYCTKPANDDYISYFVPFDVQGSYDFYHLLVNSAYYHKKNADIRSLSNLNIYADNDISKGERYQYRLLHPKSFVVTNQNKMLVFLDYQDIVPRSIIPPTFKLTGLREPSSGRKYTILSNWQIRFSITPYDLSTPYNSINKAIILGAPDYPKLKALVKDKLTTKVADAYGDIFKRYYSTFGTDKQYYYDLENITEFDYVYPHIANKKILERVENIKATHNDTAESLGLLPGYPTPGRKREQVGTLDSYLPAYKLMSIQIVDKKSVTVLHSFDREQIDQLLASKTKTAGLLYSGENVTDKDIAIRYNYQAQPYPEEINSLLREPLGTKYILSDIGYYETVDINIANPVSIYSMPASCFAGMDTSDGEMAERGFSKKSVEAFVQSLPRTRSCSLVERSVYSVITSGNPAVGEFLSNIYSSQ